MVGALLLVGSIPLETAEEVMRTFGGGLGAWLDYLPNGEVGDRRYWIDCIAYRVLNGHPEIETLQRPAPDERGMEEWRPRGSDDQFKFRVKPGVDRVRFGNPGWRLGYARDAISSYFVFRQLRKEGVIPSHVRFQVSLPSTYSAVTVFFPDPADHPRILPGFTTALADEVAKMAEKIPSEDLAIQWDLAIETDALKRTPGGRGRRGDARSQTCDRAAANHQRASFSGCRIGLPLLLRHAEWMAIAQAAKSARLGDSSQSGSGEFRS